MERSAGRCPRALGRTPVSDVRRNDDFRRASHPRERDQINQEEIEALMAPIPELVDQLEALEPVMDAWFDGLPDDFSCEFHCGVMISGPAAQINWLAELILHGDDIARSVGVPWEISERDMLLVAPRGGRGGAGLRARRHRPRHRYLRGATDPRCAAVCHPRARRGRWKSRVRRADDRPDAVVKVPASTMAAMILNRIGPFTAARRGLAHRRRTAAVESDEASVLHRDGLTMRQHFTGTAISLRRRNGSVHGGS